jgi:hypothetical protein
MHHATHDMEACIKACLDCHATCLATIDHCLTMGGQHAEASHIRIMMDCAQICVVSADFLSRGSSHHAHLCRECAEICRECAQNCDGHPGADDMMRRCAESCRRCAAECEKMAA